MYPAPEMTPGIALKADVINPDPVACAIDPSRINTSALTFVAAVVVSHATCKNRYSVVRFDAAICVEALELWATVVSRLVIRDPTMMPLVNCTALDPSALGLCQSRKFARPDCPEAFVTAMTETELYHVPAENSPDVAAERRQESMADPKGTPDGWAVGANVAAAFSVRKVCRENKPDAVVPTVHPVVEVDAAGVERFSSPALDPDCSGLSRNRVSMDAATLTSR